MLKPAFSTVACPELTLARVARLAADSGYLGVELRTFGDGSRRFACEPSLTDPAKTRRLMREAGLSVVSIATGERFDRRVFPPVLGTVLTDTEGPIRAAKRAIDLAVALECPLVRVFGYELPPAEKRSRGLSRVAERLGKVVDHAHRTGVMVAVENGGSWNTAAQLRELLDAVGSNLLGACYNVPVGFRAGDTPAQIATLGSRLLAMRVSDWKGHDPVKLGAGDIPCAAFAQAAMGAGLGGPCIFEWNRAWSTDLAPASGVLPEAAKVMFGWLAGHAPAAGRHEAVAGR